VIAIDFLNKLFFPIKSSILDLLHSSCIIISSFVFVIFYYVQFYYQG
jgi:hypothetical protein